MMRIDGHRTPTAAMPCAVNVWTKNIKPQRTTKPCREKLNVYGIAWFAWWLDIEDLRKCRRLLKRSNIACCGRTRIPCAGMLFLLGKEDQQSSRSTSASTNSAV